MLVGTAREVVGAGLEAGDRGRVAVQVLVVLEAVGRIGILVANLVQGILLGAPRSTAIITVPRAAVSAVRAPGAPSGATYSGATYSGDGVGSTVVADAIGHRGGDAIGAQGGAVVGANVVHVFAAVVQGALLGAQVEAVERLALPEARVDAAEHTCI